MNYVGLFLYCLWLRVVVDECLVGNGVGCVMVCFLFIL
jgi:hypothetical protein